MADSIEKIVEDNTTYLSENVTFVLGEKSFYNEIADNGLPAGQALFLMDYFVKTSGQMKQYNHFTANTQLTILIVKKYTPDAVPRESIYPNPELGGTRNLLIESCRNLAYEFIAAIRNDKRAQFVAAGEKVINYEMIAVRNLFDANMDGILLNMTAPTLVTPICPPIHDGPKPP